VVKADQTADARFIKVIRTHEQMVIVGEGVAEGEQVVVDGQQRLYPGAKVNIVVAKKP